MVQDMPILYVLLEDKETDDEAKVQATYKVLPCPATRRPHR